MGSYSGLLLSKAYRASSSIPKMRFLSTLIPLLLVAACSGFSLPFSFGQGNETVGNNSTNDNSSYVDVINGTDNSTYDNSSYVDLINGTDNSTYDNSSYVELINGTEGYNSTLDYDDDEDDDEDDEDDDEDDEDDDDDDDDEEDEEEDLDEP